MGESESVVRELKNIEEYSLFYSYSCYCGNCGERNYRYIKKGRKLDGLTTDCDKCGCEIVMSGSQLAAWG